MKSLITYNNSSGKEAYSSKIQKARLCEFGFEVQKLHLYKYILETKVTINYMLLT